MHGSSSARHVRLRAAPYARTSVLSTEREPTGLDGTRVVAEMERVCLLRLSEAPKMIPARADVLLDIGMQRCKVGNNSDRASKERKRC